jgi:hypothetical protein
MIGSYDLLIFQSSEVINVVYQRLKYENSVHLGLRVLVMTVF